MKQSPNQLESQQLTESDTTFISSKVEVISYNKEIAALLLVLLASFIFTVVYGINYKVQTNHIIFIRESFKFHVYCPISSNSTVFITTMRDLGMPVQTNFIIPNDMVDVYAIYVNAYLDNSTSNGNNTNGTAKLNYCGYARNWNESNCENAQFICSTPGPMFYVERNRPIDVIWINNINSSQFENEWPVDADSQSGCYIPDSNDAYCSPRAKNSNDTIQGNCSYFDPTDLQNHNYKTVRVSKDRHPISAHVHGMSIRPAFDGNPLNWFNNVNDKGIGFTTLQDSSFFNYFEAGIEQNLTEFNFSLLSSSKIKVNRYMNFQNPGLLFYHDHAMSSTRFNVRYGLSGIYVINDPVIEKDLPHGQAQKIIVFSQLNEGDNRNKIVGSPLTEGNNRKKIVGSPLTTDETYITDQNYIYLRNMTYRFRILNAHFDTIYRNNSFVVFYTNTTAPNGSIISTEDSPGYQSNFTGNMHFLNMTFIAADTSLMNTPIRNIQSIDLAPAQRVQVLIKFDSTNIPDNIRFVYLVCDDDSDDYAEYNVKFKLELSPSYANNPFKTPEQYLSFDVPFTDLSLIPQNQIALSRVRGLFNHPSEQKFFINGHYMFEEGQSENPKIGTTEDWYIVNNVLEQHPIHIHLINFQAIGHYSLKTTPNLCTYYQLDFFIQSNISIFQNLSIIDLCDYLLNMTDKEMTPQVFAQLDNYNLEQSFQNSSIGLVSGLNVMQKVQNTSEQATYELAGCDSSYKYICQNISDSIPLIYRKWKDTTRVEPYSVLVIRIRWKKTQFNDATDTYPYFNVPEDQLVEFPGYVYHCHILMHQDNQMMRPIMLQYSDAYIKHATNQKSNASAVQGNGLCSWKLSWKEKLECINAQQSCQ